MFHSNYVKYLAPFLPARRYASMVLAVIMRLSVRHKSDIARYWSKIADLNLY